MSNIIVPLEHQASPKETDLDREVRLAMEEISAGKFQVHEAENGWETGTSRLEQHPRVQEALRKLGTQVQDKTAHEYLEVAQYLHELNEVMQSDRQWPGQQRWQGKEMEAMRLVNPMTPFAFIDKLVAAGISAEKEPEVLYEQRFHPITGILEPARVEQSSALICLGKFVANGVCGLYAHVNTADGVAYERVSLLQVAVGPEWDLIRFDEWGVPIGKRYQGWRTAVLALIQKRVITEAQAEKAFGKPLENAASSFYRQQLFEFRNEA